MNKYSVRPATIQDIRPVHEIMVTQRAIDFSSAMNLNDLQKKWEKLDLEEDTLLAFTDGELVGYAELLDNDAPFIYLKDRGDIDLAFQLLMLLEQKAVSRAKETFELFTQISEKNQTFLQLFASNGYHSNLSFITMELNLETQPSSPQWPDGIQVRTFVPGQDEQSTYETDEEAGKDKGYHNPLSYERWVKRMGLEQGSFDPSIWFLACEGEKVVGAALNAYDEDSGTAWVDHLSVLREWRKQGIGKALLLHSFDEFYKRSINTIKLNVDSKSLTNASKLYESVGMKTVQQYHIYKKEMRV